MMLHRLVIAFVCIWTGGQQAAALEFFAEINAPSVTQGPDGHLRGYYIDYINEILETAEMNASVKAVPWKRAYVTTQDVPGTALFPTARTKEREDLFKWIGPIGITWWQLFKRKEDPLVIRTIDQARHIGAIGVVRGSAREAWLKARKFPNLFAVSDHAAMHMMLQRGRLRLVASSSNGVKAHLRKMGLPPDQAVPVLEYRTCYLYLATNRYMSPQIIDRLQSALDRLKTSGRMYNIRKKYAPPGDDGYKRGIDILSDLASTGKSCE